MVDSEVSDRYNYFMDKVKGYQFYSRVSRLRVNKAGLFFSNKDDDKELDKIILSCKKNNHPVYYVTDSDGYEKGKLMVLKW